MIQLFCGEDVYESYKASKETASQIASKKQIDLKIINADEMDPVSFIDAIEGIDMFSNGTVILAKRALNNKRLVEVLNERFEHFNSYDLLLWQDGKADLRTALVKKLKEQKTLKDFPSLKQWQFEKWLKTELVEKKIKLSTEQIHYLLTHVELNKLTLLSELEKISLFLQSKRVTTLTNAELSEILGFDIKGDIWVFLDAFGEKNLDKALTEYKKLTTYETLGQYLIVMIARELSNIAQILILTEKKEDLKQLGLHPFVLEKTVKKSRNFTLAEVTKLMDDLIDTDVAIKSGDIDEDLGLTMFLTKSFSF
jgi:DNA polymerase III delta subunit